MGKTDIGQGKQSLLLAAAGYAGYRSAAATATSATSLTDSGATGWVASSPTSNYGSANCWTGFLVIAGSGTSTVYGVVTSNTTTVLNVDKWYNPLTPTGAAASTPSSTTPYCIIPIQAPVYWMAISTGSVAATDTALASEQTANGLSRQAATFAHTFSNSSANNTYTLTSTWTYTTTGAITLTSIGVFDSALSSTGVPLHTTALSSSATLSASGDSVTVTQTVTM